uniref:ATP synthase subunit a n=1 Tax=Obrium sp. NS-2015 TaxID=1776756 RepID=A0A0U4B902_9CUCU|nr:ATP synthase F0 subunit 6 [Obrium sp. NS-2015]
MMANLFSSFDPSTSLNLSLNWISLLSSIFLIPLTYWFLPTRTNLIWTKINSNLHQEIKILLGNYNYSNTPMFISLFFIIMINNFLGLFPYIFTSTSHMALNLSLALPLWISFMVYGWFNNTIHMLAHLIPQGTPPGLMPFMVCIETISNMIRPGTLAIRLTANMIAGHLLMTLLGNTGSLMPMFLLKFLILVQIMLLILEAAVAIIQAYVFAVLSALYSSEVN